VTTSTASAAPFSVEIDQHIFNEDGYPDLNAGTEGSAGSRTFEWSICGPGVACVPISDFNGDAQSLEPGEVAPGTYFTVKATRGNATASTKSKTWQGTVSALAPPGFKIPPTIGKPLFPSAADWRGGWGDDYNVLGVEACRNKNATRCETVWAPDEDYPYSNKRPALGPYYAGWYLFSTNKRYAAETAFGGVGHFDAAGVPPIEASPTTVRSLPFGPIAPNKYSAVIPAKATVRRGRVVVARVHCPVRCRARFSSNISVSRSYYQDSGSREFKGTVELRAKVLDEVKRATVKTRVWIDHGLAARGSSRIARLPRD
jgi:hypothetical protein